MKAFKAWQDHVTDERILMWSKETDADDHNDRYVLEWYFSSSEIFMPELLT